MNLPQATVGASDVVEPKVRRGAVTATDVERESRDNTDAQVVMLWNPLTVSQVTALSRSSCWAAVRLLEITAQHKSEPALALKCLQIESDLGSRVYNTEWPSHLTMRSVLVEGGAAGLLNLIQQRITHYGEHSYPSAVRLSGPGNLGRVYAII